MVIRDVVWCVVLAAIPDVGCVVWCGVAWCCVVCDAGGYSRRGVWYGVVCVVWCGVV
jgi:hypothetical protein